MTNVRKNKLKCNDLDYLYNELSKSKQVLIEFSYKYLNIEFNTLDRCVQDDSLCIAFNSDTSKYFLFNRSANNRLAQNGDIQRQILLLSNSTQDQYKIIESLTQCVVKQVATITPQKSNKPKPTKTSTTKKPIFCEYKTPLGKACLKHLESKTGANTQTLSKYNVKPIKERFFKNGNSFKHNENNICFGYKVGDSIKIKQPFSLDYKYLFVGTNNDYIFGYEQLPNKGEVLIICAGEDDTICINHHLNKLGVFAICLYSELSTLPTSKAKEFKARFSKTYVLYDNDKTGINSSKDIALKNGFIWIDFKMSLYDYTGVNDICDLYQKTGNQFTPILTNILKSNDSIKQFKDDNYSIAIPHCYVVNFDQYLTDKQNNIEQLTQIISTHKRTLIQSAAGTGKSWGFFEVAQKLLSSEKYQRVVKVVPTLAICGQISNTAKEKGIYAYELKGSKNWSIDDEEGLRNSDLVISTYDSLTKIPLHYFNDTALFIDEAHQLCNDISYRNKAMIKLYDYLNKATTVCYMTATPNYFFFSDLVKPYLGDIKLIIGKHNLDNKIKVQIHTEVKNKKHAKVFLEEGVSNSKDSTICMKLDDSKVLNTWCDMDEKRGISSDYFTSQDSKQSTENKNYNSIQETGKLSSYLAILYYTTLMEAGISFKFLVSSIVVFDTKAACKLIQLATRARYNQLSGINKNIDFHILLSKQKNQYSKGRTGEQQLKKHIETSIQLAELYNDSHSGDKRINKKTDFYQSFIYKDIDGIWKVCIFSILHQIFKDQQNEQTPELLAKRLSRYDSRFLIENIAPLHIDKTPELTKLLQEVKVQHEVIKDKAIQSLCENPLKTIAAYLTRLKDVDRKDSIRLALLIPKFDKEDLIQYTQENKESFTRGGVKVIGKIVNLISKRNKHLGSSLIESISLIEQKGIKALEESTESALQVARIKLVKSSMRKFKKGEYELIEASEHDQLQFSIDRAITKVFDKIRDNASQGRIKGKLTALQITKKINKAIKGLITKPIGRNKAIARLKVLYELKKNSKTKLYTIGAKTHQK